MTFHCTVHSTEAVFRSPVSISVSSSRRSWASIASSVRDANPNGKPQPVLLDADLHHLVNERDLEMQAGHGGGVVFAEPEDDRLLVGFDRVAGIREQPDRQEKPDDPGKERQIALPGLPAAPNLDPAADIRRMAPCVEIFLVGS